MFWVYRSETLKLVSELETFFLFHMKSEDILYILQLIFKFICDHITLYIFLSYHLLQYHPSLYILFFFNVPLSAVRYQDLRLNHICACTVSHTVGP